MGLPFALLRLLQYFGSVDIKASVNAGICVLIGIALLLLRGLRLLYLLSDVGSSLLPLDFFKLGLLF